MTPAPVIIDRAERLLHDVPAGTWVHWKTCTTKDAARQAAYHLRIRLTILGPDIEVRVREVDVWIRREVSKGWIKS